MGVSTSKNGLLTITDYDIIEISNLNRQFLFNNTTIDRSKSFIACKEIKNINNNFN
jgi:molybdopterin/thiamine biosynthesis adenylyltransferase